jgi:hypothetical protein
LWGSLSDRPFKEESEEKAKKAGALLPRGLKAVLKLLFG